MQEALATGDTTNRLSKVAFDQSSGSIPKAKRPQFKTEDEEVEQAVDTLSSMLPDASIGSSRQTIEIYDPNGTMGTLERLLGMESLAKLMPNGRDRQTKAIITNAMVDNPDFAAEMESVYGEWGAVFLDDKDMSSGVKDIVARSLKAKAP